jgi:hypothetical protein
MHIRKTAQPPKHITKNCETTAEKPPSHESITEKTVRAQSSKPVQPPKLKKPPTIMKMVEPISKRKLAWETTEEEGKTTISALHVHDFFNNLNTKLSHPIFRRKPSLNYMYVRITFHTYSDIIVYNRNNIT